MVTLRWKQTMLLLGASLIVLVALGVLVLRMMPPPHRPFEYMIAGTASTGVGLAFAFGVIQFYGRKR